MTFDNVSIDNFTYSASDGWDLVDATPERLELTHYPTAQHLVFHNPGRYVVESALSPEEMP
jgi:hypothetical protein